MATAPTLAPSYEWYLGDNYETITAVHIVDSYNQNLVPSGATLVDSWAVDADGTGAIMCYEFSDSTVILAGNGSGKIFANADSTYFMDSFADLATITGLEILDTSRVTNMSRMFSGCTTLTELDLSSWNTSSVTDMSQMFYGASRLTTVNVGGFDTSRVTNMSAMFRNCAALTDLDVSSFSTASVSSSSSMEYFAYNCPALTTIVLGKNFIHATNILPAAGQRGKGMFCASSSVETTVKGANDIMLAYDWSGDRRTVTFVGIKYMIDEYTLVGIANAIREVTGTSEKITPLMMPDKIRSIKT